MLNNYKSQLIESQAAMLALLDAADSESLYTSEGDDWSLAQNLVHISEARTFYAEAIGRLAATPGITIGRDLSHASRMRAIEEHGGWISAEIRSALIKSHDAVMTTLNNISEADLSGTGHNEAWGEHTVAEFIERFFISHDQSHIKQSSERK